MWHCSRDHFLLALAPGVVSTAARCCVNRMPTALCLRLDRVFKDAPRSRSDADAAAEPVSAGAAAAALNPHLWDSEGKSFAQWVCPLACSVAVGITADALIHRVVPLGTRVR